MDRIEIIRKKVKALFYKEAVCTIEKELKKLCFDKYKKYKIYDRAVLFDEDFKSIHLYEIEERLISAITKEGVPTIHKSVPFEIKIERYTNYFRVSFHNEYKDENVSFEPYMTNQSIMNFFDSLTKMIYHYSVWVSEIGV